MKAYWLFSYFSIFFAVIADIGVRHPSMHRCTQGQFMKLANPFFIQSGKMRSRPRICFGLKSSVKKSENAKVGRLGQWLGRLGINNARHLRGDKCPTNLENGPFPFTTLTRR